MKQMITLPMAWGLIKFILFVFLLAVLVESRKRFPTWIMNYRAKTAGVDKVDSMTGEKFEIWLEHQFAKAGYSVKRTRYQKDHGADLIITKPDGTKIAVQAKQSSKRNARAGAKTLGEVLRGKDYYNCNEAMMITNQGYTQQAKDEARKIGIKLMDRKELIEFIEKTNEKNKKHNKPRK